jgi:hypothetical protein
MKGKLPEEPVPLRLFRNCHTLPPGYYAGNLNDEVPFSNMFL